MDNNLTKPKIEFIETNKDDYDQLYLHFNKTLAVECTIVKDNDDFYKALFHHSKNLPEVIFYRYEYKNEMMFHKKTIIDNALKKKPGVLIYLYSDYANYNIMRIRDSIFLRPLIDGYFCFDYSDHLNFYTVNDFFLKNKSQILKLEFSALSLVEKLPFLVEKWRNSSLSKL